MGSNYYLIKTKQIQLKKLIRRRSFLCDAALKPKSIPVRRSRQLRIRFFEVTVALNGVVRAIKTHVLQSSGFEFTSRSILWSDVDENSRS